MDIPKFCSSPETDAILLFDDFCQMVAAFGMNVVEDEIHYVDQYHFRGHKIENSAEKEKEVSQVIKKH